MYDRFGFSVSIDGDFAVIGSYHDEDSRGSAYVYRRNGTGWIEEQKLLASDGVKYDAFGYSVSIDGDYMVIGSYGDDDNGDNSGSAYIFTRSGSIWTQQAKLIPSDGAPSDYFGALVSIDGDYVIIGAHFDDDNGYESGSAYIFTRSGSIWTQQAKLLASDGSAEDLFGNSASIDGDIALIGADGDDDSGAGSGSAYVFTRSGSVWTEQAKLLASDGDIGDYFGSSVSICGYRAIIGASGKDGVYEDSGAAYIFKLNDTIWVEEQKLLASDGGAYDNFGCSVSIDGDYIIIGSYGDDDNGAYSGSAYIFTRVGENWIEEEKLIDEYGEKYDYFGVSVSIDGDYALIGVQGDNSYRGSAFVFVNSGLNQPPYNPTITGPIVCKPQVVYVYFIGTIDYDDDRVFYYIDWDDGNISDWIGPYSSGEVIAIDHNWSEEREYIVRIKAKDIFGQESDWGRLRVIVSKSKAVNRPIFNWLQSHPNLFPILQKLLH